MLQDWLNIGLNGGSLQIKTSSSALAKTTSAINYLINGYLYSKAAWDLAALTGYNVTSAYTAVLSVFLDSAWTFSYEKSAEVANTATFRLGDVASLKSTASKALVGYIVIKNATASVFTGGTTALDAANITATYIDVFAPIAR